MTLGWLDLGEEEGRDGTGPWTFMGIWHQSQEG